MFTVVFCAALAATIIGMAIPVSQERAKQVSNELNQTIDTLKTNNAVVQYIFGNNLMICLLMFIPVIGPVVGFYALFNTGATISAIAVSQGIHPALALAALFITPVAWLEYGSYSIAMAESIWLLHRSLNKKGRSELRNTSVLIALCTVVLLVSAIIETAILYLT